MRWSAMPEPGGNSRPVVSTQKGVHENLAGTVRKHLSSVHARPPSSHALEALEIIRNASDPERPLILDAGCGTGDSTHMLAERYPGHLVIGVDKSASRLERERQAHDPENMLRLRADLMDLYPLLAKAGIRLARHFIFYANPWPKPGHLLRRWHGSPVFPALVSLGGHLELRTNWQIYAEEFCEALAIAGAVPAFSVHVPAEDHVSLFEKKYDASGHTLFRVTADLKTRIGA